MVTETNTSSKASLAEIAASLLKLESEKINVVPNTEAGKTNVLSDADLDAWIRRANRTTYHYSSTCRMGRRDDGEWDGGAVVDEGLRVYGVRGVRVADSSVFPCVPRTHTQAPTVAVAEKCADMILRGM